MNDIFRTFPPWQSIRDSNSRTFERKSKKCRVERDILQMFHQQMLIVKYIIRYININMGNRYRKESFLPYNLRTDFSSIILMPRFTIDEWVP